MRLIYKRSVGIGTLASAARLDAGLIYMRSVGIGALASAARLDAGLIYMRSVGIGTLASAARLDAALRTAPRRASFRCTSGSGRCLSTSNCFSEGLELQVDFVHGQSGVGAESFPA
jgi:hypothetical protein